MTEYAVIFTVRDGGGLYFADPYHHTRWTSDIRAARAFLDYPSAKKTADREVCEVVPVALVVDFQDND